MDKLILVSIIVATVTGPLLGARDPNARRGLKRMLAFLFAFYALYLVLVTQVFARFYVPTAW